MCHMKIECNIMKVIPYRLVMKKLPMVIYMSFTWKSSMIYMIMV